MATKVVMEALSPTMEEGRLVEWKKNEGDKVAQGDVLAEVETDKAVMDLVARADGTLLKQVLGAGQTVPVGDLVGVIGDAGEDVSAIVGGGDKADEAGKAGAAAKADQTTQPTAGTTDRDVSMPPAAPAGAATESAGRAPAAAAQTAQTASTATDGGRIKASPLARKLAADRGLDLGAIQGSGPAGRVVQRDVEAAGSAPAQAPAGAPAVPAFQPAASGEPYQDIPLTQIRKTIAKRLAQSIGPIPTFYLTTEIDMERVWEARQALNAPGDGPKVSLNDITIKAVALALRQHPMCNAWWQDDRIRAWNEVHVGMAVAIDEGLITPVIRHADQKSLRQIAVEAKELAGRARDRRLKPEEYTGATFSVSNLGMLDIDEFTAIINPPEAGILAIGRIAERAVVNDGVIDVRRRMRVTMSCDHRIIDGATGARFLQTLTRMLENPLALVW
jgi:pyruvate dehydrogenase E2 component (dihydrolipoamide acetyltransferase)